MRGERTLENGATMRGVDQARADRLRNARASYGIKSASAAAERFQWPVSTYRSHENATRNFNELDADKYARAFQVSPQWLWSGRGNKNETAQTVDAEVSPPQRVLQYSGRMLDVKGIAAASDRGHYVFTSQIVESVACPPALDRVADAYAVYVQNDSMEPRYFAGEILFIHPGKPPRKGDFVLVQISHGGDEIEPLVKRFVGETATAYELEQYNPPKRFDVEKNRVIAIHLVHLAGNR